MPQTITGKTSLATYGGEQREIAMRPTIAKDLVRIVDLPYSVEPGDACASPAFGQNELAQ